MKPLLKGFSIVAVTLCLLAGCATDPAMKPWWTLRDANFMQFQPGKTTKADVRAALGSPILESIFPRQAEEVWDYRFAEGARIMMAWVYFDARGVFKYYTAQLDPAYVNAEGHR